MLSNRSIGFRSLSALLLLALVTFSFWGWLFIWENAWIFDRVVMRKYCLYNEFLLIGVLFGMGRRRLAQGPHREFIEALRRGTRQAVSGVFGILVLVFLLQDTYVSRSFLLSFVPWLFTVLFFANYIAPKWLGKWVFSGAREEQRPMAGTLEQAYQVKPWLERKRMIGFNSVGVVSPQPVTAGNETGQSNGQSNGHGASFRVLGCLDNMEERF